MAFDIVADDFIGKEIPLTDKLNAVNFTLGEAAAIASDALDVEDPRIDTILMAKTWFDFLIEAIEGLEEMHPTAYNDIEEQTFILPEDFREPYDNFWVDDGDEDWDDSEEDDGSWVDDECPSTTELLGSDE